MLEVQSISGFVFLFFAVFDQNMLIYVLRCDIKSLPKQMTKQVLVTSKLVASQAIVVPTFNTTGSPATSILLPKCSLTSGVVLRLCSWKRQGSLGISRGRLRREKERERERPDKFNTKKAREHVRKRIVCIPSKPRHHHQFAGPVSAKVNKGCVRAVSSLSERRERVKANLVRGLRYVGAYNSIQMNTNSEPCGYSS